MERKNSLDVLAADRAVLAERLRAPWWLPVGFGLIAAVWVSVPALGDEAPADFVLIAALVATIAMLGGYRKVTGIRTSGLGGFAWLFLGLAMFAMLSLISVAYGLASFDLTPWIVIPALLAFAIAASLTVSFTSAVRERMLSVR